MFRRSFLRGSVQAATGLLLSARRAPAQHAPEPAQPDTLFSRADWLRLLHRVSGPVLEAAAEGQLQARMPVQAAPGHAADRRRVTCLEAVGRTLSGIAPWLEHGPTGGDEGVLRSRLRSLAQHTIAAGVEKGSPPFLNFGHDRQTIVDAGFLSLAVARAPQTLREDLPAGTRRQLADALRATRSQLPVFSNWLLFAAMVEAALFQLGEPWDRMRVDYALREHASWFLGDGTYGDGPHFHADYYNSYVIHPFLLALMDVFAKEDTAWRAMDEPIRARARRYAELQERAIAPDGSFPPVGRSLTYRCGAFHLLADVALRQSLPGPLPPPQVRSALGAVIRRTLLAPATFDEHGWLRIGLCGDQPRLGEVYISTGSLYLCTAAFLPLGLEASNPFWTGPAVPWTSQRVWSGADVVTDHAQD